MRFARVIRRVPLPLIALVAVAAIYLSLLCLLPNESAWCGDNAYRVLQVQTLVHERFSHLAIRWSGAAIAGDPQYLPVAPPFLTFGPERYQRAYSIYFSALVAPFFALFGYAGLKILPLVGSVLLLWGCPRLAKLLGGAPGMQAATVLLAGLCTPVFFYTGTFWEHTLAAAAILWSIVFLLRARQAGGPISAVLSALLLGLSIWLREENYLLAPILFFAVPTWPLRLRFLIAAMAVILPLWLLNHHLYGDILGLHVRFNQPMNEGFIDHLRDRAIVLYRAFVSSSPSAWLSLLLVSPYLAALALSSRRSTRPKTIALLMLGAALSGIWMLRGAWSASHRGAWIGSTGSLFALCPLVLIGLFRDTAGEERIIRRIAIAYGLVIALIMPIGSSVGFHWAGRLLFPLYPILIVVGCVFISRQWSKSFSAPLAVLVLVSFMLQTYSIYLLWQRSEGVAELTRTVRKVPRAAIITEGREILDYLFPVFFTQPMFYAETMESRDELVTKLKAANVEEFLLITQEPTGAPFAVVDDRRGLLHRYFIYRYHL